MIGKPQHYIQAEFALSGWITLIHIDDAEVETKTTTEIINAALALPWIASMIKNDDDYGDMLAVRLVGESLSVIATQTINHETPTNRQ